MTYLARQSESIKRLGPSGSVFRANSAPCTASRERDQEPFSEHAKAHDHALWPKKVPDPAHQLASRWVLYAPGGLTLIELLVVIVILVTLVAGVIPLVSPNNDARKIREASRGLQSYINATQAEAARTGRPHGIGLVENPSGDGMALEVFRMEVPLAFAGFSDASRVLVTALGPSDPYETYTGTIARYMGYPLYRVNFGIATGGVDLLPPGMFKPFDTVEVAGNKFLIVDSPNNTNNGGMADKLFEYGIAPNTSWYFGDPSGDQNKQVSDLECVWINASNQQLPIGAKPYKIIRQPVTSSASPLVFPAGIGIDLQGSVQEGGTITGLPVPNSFATPRTTTGTNPQIIPDSVSIMFSPNGNVSSLIHNGNQITSVSRIVLLLGRVENGGLSYEPDDANSSGDVTSGDWTMNTGDSNEQLAQKQSEINWLNLDSRLLGIAVRSGRVVVHEVAFVDARLSGNLEPAEQAAEQIEAAHEIAHAMKRGGGR